MDTYDTREEEPDGAQEQTERRTAPSLSVRSKRQGLFQLRGGSILYCLSAVAILWGIAQIVTPVLATTKLLSKTLPCIGALHLYELALLGVLALIVVWRNVTDDAVFLVVLIGLFLVASGLTLATIANDKPGVALAVGAASCAVAAGKLYVLRRATGVPLRAPMLVGIGVLLAWNFLMSSAMALVVGLTLDSDTIIRSVWLLGWLVMLAAGVIMLLHAARTGSGHARRPARDTPFLRTPGMAWTFCLTLLLAANAQQYALTYIFDVPSGAGDFLPAVVLGSLLALALMRAFGKRFGVGEVVAATVPVAATFLAVVTRGVVQGPVLGVGLLWYPPVLLAIAGTAVVWLSVRNGWHQLWHVLPAYVLVIVLTAGRTPAEVRPLNWQPFGIALAALLFAAGLLFRRPFLALAAVLVVSIAAALSGKLKTFAIDQELAMAAVIGLVAGLGVLVVYAVLPRDLPRWIAALGSMVLAASTIGCFGGPSLLDYPIGSGLVVAAVGAAVWLRARDLLVSAVAFVPLVRALYVGTKQARGWRYVAVSFVLLVAGMLVSLRKGRHLRHSGGGVVPNVPGASGTALRSSRN